MYVLHPCMPAASSTAAAGGGGPDQRHTCAYVHDHICIPFLPYTPAASYEPHNTSTGAAAWAAAIIHALCLSTTAHRSVSNPTFNAALQLQLLSPQHSAWGSSSGHASERRPLIADRVIVEDRLSKCTRLMRTLADPSCCGAAGVLQWRRCTWQHTWLARRSMSMSLAPCEVQIHQAMAY